MKKQKLFSIGVVALLYIPVMLFSSNSMLASPPTGPEIKVKTELSFIEQPAVGKWTTVRLRATALNDWPLGDIPVHIEGTGIVVRTENRQWPVWKNIQKGSTFETTFRIYPCRYGATNIAIKYNSGGYVQFITFDKHGIKFTGTYDDAVHKLGINKRDKRGNWMMTDAQNEALDKYVSNSYDAEPIVNDTSIVFQYANFTFRLSPWPSLNKISKLIITKIAENDESAPPVLLYHKISSVSFPGIEGLQDMEFPGRRMDTERYIASKGFIKLNDDFFSLETSIMPTNIGFQRIDISVSTFGSLSIGFMLDGAGELKSIGTDCTGTIEVEK